MVVVKITVFPASSACMTLSRPPFAEQIVFGCVLESIVARVANQVAVTTFAAAAHTLKSKITPVILFLRMFFAAKPPTDCASDNHC